MKDKAVHFLRLIRHSNPFSVQPRGSWRLETGEESRNLNFEKKYLLPESGGAQLSPAAQATVSMYWLSQSWHSCCHLFGCVIHQDHAGSEAEKEQEA